MNSGLGTHRRHHLGSSTRLLGLLLVAAALLIGTAASAFVSRSDSAFDWASNEPGEGTSTVVATPGPDQVSAPVIPARRAPSVVRPEAPRTARLPSGTVVAIQAVSTRSDGRLDVPDDIRTAGWWRGGSRLGDPFGSTLLAAHIDSTTQGLGPYVELLSVRPDQRITVTSTSLEQSFAVRSLRLVPQGSLADNRWIFAARGDRRLTLVTCAPPYDASRGGYQNLAIVTAAPVADPTARTR